MLFALLTVRLINGTVTVAVKNGTVKKTENGTDTVAVTNSDALLYENSSKDLRINNPPVALNKNYIQKYEFIFNIGFIHPCSKYYMASFMNLVQI